MGVLCALCFGPLFVSSAPHQDRHLDGRSQTYSGKRIGLCRAPPYMSSTCVTNVFPEQIPYR